MTEERPSEQSGGPDAGAAEPRHTKSWRELGPAWISAIGVMIASLATAGVFALFDIPNGQSQTDNAADTSEPPGSNDQPEASLEVGSEELTAAVVVFRSNVVHDLDADELPAMGHSTTVEDDGLRSTPQGGGDFATEGSYVVVVWPEDSLPSKADCRQHAIAQGGTRTQPLEVGDTVCGLTTQDRIFRVEILGVGTDAIRGDVVVWNP